MVPIPWTFKAYEISMTIFIGISCLLFLHKLFIAIRLRKRMGYKNFGPLQVLFIMFAQCLVIPGKYLSRDCKKSWQCGVVIIYVLDFTVSKIHFLGQLAQTFLVVSLPLSALWASHESEQSPVPRTSLSNVSENSSNIAKKFRFLRHSKQGSHEDLEKSSCITETTTTSIRHEKRSDVTSEDTFPSWVKLLGWVWACAAGGLGCENSVFLALGNFGGRILNVIVNPIYCT